PSITGQAVTFTATVAANAPGSGTASGTVTFGAGKLTLSTVNLDSAGHATFTTTSLPAGTSTISARYKGDGNFLTSTGRTTQTVGQSTTSGGSITTTTVTSSANPSVFGQVVTFTATVVDTKVGTPQGTVTFLDGKVTLGTSTLNSAGVATF